MQARFKCRTCGTLFVPHESTHFSELYCSPVCWEAWDRYRKRLDNFKRSMDAYNNGERATPPKQPAGLHIPEEDECERSRKEILAAMRRRAEAKEQRTEKRGRKPKPKEEQPPYKEYRNKAWRRNYTRVCHTCGTPCNNYWCDKCMAKRRKKYGITDSVWEDE